MKKIVFIFILALTVTACGANEPGVDDANVHTHEFTQHGLELKSTITVDSDMIVNATLTNVSGEPIIYNNRCEIPFGISVQKDDANLHLIHDEQHVDCDDLFDPNDLVEMAADETFEKEIIFKRQINVSDNRTTHALSGTYNIAYSFQLHEGGRFHSSTPIELVVDKQPDILTVGEARKAAKTDEKVQAWLQLQEKEGRKVSVEQAILRDGKWIVLYHSIHLDERAADRINIQMDAKSGEIFQVRSEVLSEESGEGIVQFIKERALESIS